MTCMFTINFTDQLLNRMTSYNDHWMISITILMTSYWNAWKHIMTIKWLQWQYERTSNDIHDHHYRSLNGYHGIIIWHSVCWKLFSLRWPWHSEGRGPPTSKWEIGPRWTEEKRTSSKIQKFGRHFDITWVIQWLYEAMKVISCTILWTVYECHEIHFSLWYSVWDSWLHTPP